MTDAITRYAESAFVLSVTGAALSPWPWTALLVGAAYLLGLAYVTDRRTPPVETK